MKFIKQTFKSLTRREKGVSLFLLSLFLLNGFLFLNAGKLSTGSSTSIYTEALIGGFKHLNPVYTEFNEADADVSSLIFSGLVRYNVESGLFEEDLATHTLSDDQLTYTFTLKNNAMWQDGTEVSAEDVYFTYHDIIQAPDFNNPVLKANFEGVKVESKDSRTITFTLNSPNNFFFSSLTVGILPKHILENVPPADLDTDPFNQKPIGSGPYKVTEPYTINADGSAEVLLEASESYYGEEPKIKKIRFVSYPNLEGLIKNRSTWHAAARIPQNRLEEVPLDQLVANGYELPQYTALFINTDSPKLLKNKVRLGLSKAIDKEAILEAIGYKARVDTPLLELNQKDWIYQSNIEEANGALFDAGWPLKEGATYRTNEAGETLNLTLLRRDFGEENTDREEVAQKTAALIQSQLAKVGVEVLIESVTKEILDERIKKREYDLLLYGQNLGYNLDIFSYWHSSQATADGLNLSNYQNPKADYEMEALRQSFDSEERESHLQELANIISTDVPAIFLYRPNYYYLVDTRINGVNLEHVLLNKDRLSNLTQWTFN